MISNLIKTAFYSADIFNFMIKQNKCNLMHLIIISKLNSIDSYQFV